MRLFVHLGASAAAYQFSGIQRACTPVLRRLLPLCWVLQCARSLCEQLASLSSHSSPEERSVLCDGTLRNTFGALMETKKPLWGILMSLAWFLFLNWYLFYDVHTMMPAKDPSYRCPRNFLRTLDWTSWRYLSACLSKPPITLYIIFLFSPTPRIALLSSPTGFVQLS